MRFMLTGIALLILGVWGAVLREFGDFYILLGIVLPLAGIVSIALSFFKTN